MDILIGPFFTPSESISREWETSSKLQPSLGAKQRIWTALQSNSRRKLLEREPVPGSEKPI